MGETLPLPVPCSDGPPSVLHLSERSIVWWIAGVVQQLFDSGGSAGIKHFSLNSPVFT